MTPPKPCPQPAKWAGRPPSAESNAGALPEDVLSDILLRLQANELCRLRSVCRAWRALTSEPLFVREHGARHRDPLFLANPRDDPTHIHVFDLSGNVLKRIPNADGHQLLPTRLDLACVATVRNSCRVIDPATGRVHVLPETPATQHLGLENLLKPYTFFAFGRIAATGEYKVLRMFSRPTLTGLHQHHLFEVLTISSGSGSGSSHARWRARGSLDEIVQPSSAVVVGPVVYFKVDTIYEVLIETGVNPGLRPDCIVSFDLEMEEWMGLVQGPISGIFFTDEYDDHSEDYRALWSELTLAAVRGRLVLVHYRTYRGIMDLWFLEDFDNSLWVKEYRIQTGPIFPITEYCVKALFMLDDGRLVVHFAKAGLLIIYDPRTNTTVQVETRPLDAVAMYTGSLLSLQAGDMV